MPKPIIHTIGHSNLAAEDFLKMLHSHGIDCVVDVRSTPASQYNPQFNKAVLAGFLQQRGIVYLHFGREFGARHTAAHLHSADGKVDFEKVRATSNFSQGVERLRQGVEKGYFPALMCAEAEPLDCHRFSMISVFLVEKGFEVLHILKNGETATHLELEQELLRRFAKKLPQPNIFEPEIGPKEQLQAAYRLHNQLVGWSPQKEAMNNGEDAF